MAVHTRNLLLFLALAGIAATTWLLSREPESAATADSDAARPPQGYYLVDALIRETDDEGKVRFTISARRLEQLPESEDFALEGMKVEYKNQAGDNWLLEASGGYMPKDRSSFALSDVRVQLARAADNGAELATFETGELFLDARERLANTDSSVRFQAGNSERVADGMQLDLNAGTYSFGPNVTRTDSQL